MIQADREYELKVLKMTINTYLDKTVSVTETGLKSLEANQDQVVWDLATRFYTQSGHKVEFSIVRNLVNFWIGAMKAQLEAEAARRVAEEKAAQLEAARRVAEKEARLRTQMSHIFEEFAGDENKVRVFARVRQILSENLSAYKDNINLNSHLSNDLGADELDLVEIAMELEEEFDIEMPNGVDDVQIIKNLVEYICNKIAAPA